jgi:four helix bundle protein
MENERNKEEFRNRLYRYTVRLLKFLVKLPNGPVIREVKSQLTRSGTSIGANYFEARGANSKKDFQNFFAIALKSANESIFWLNVLKDTGFISKEIEKEHQHLVSETKEIAKILASSILTMKGKRN